jgi:3-dehydroquinate synthase
MQTLHVDLADRSYPIWIGQGLLNTGAYLLHPYISGQQVLIVSNPTVAAHYLAQTQQLLSAAKQLDVCLLPDGEAYKTLDNINAIISVLLEKQHHRRTHLVALGGGVTGDMTGFAAACYQRGVPFLQIPTTLLSQVDSSVGGKTGVNHALGKNMIGAFHQPSAVLMDVDVLKTLPRRELVAGLAEVIKYGLMADADFFVWLEQHADDLLALQSAALIHAIYRSCAIKAQVVSRDERESNVRATLNFGHTFGHALETLLGYGHWLHGEAVGLGMLMAVDLSARMGWVEVALVSRLENLLDRLQLPRFFSRNISVSEMLQSMQLDKKNQNGKLRLVLLKNLGEAVVTDDFDDSLLDLVLSHRQN